MHVWTTESEASVSDSGAMTPAEFDPLRPSIQQDPYPWYAMLRREAPVCHVSGRDLWFVTSRALVLEALEQPRVFSSRFGQPQSPVSAAIAERIAEIEERG